MATLTVGSNFGLRMDELTLSYLWDGEDLLTGRTLFRTRNDSVSFTDYQGFFLYHIFTDEVIGGDLTAINHYQRGSLAFSIRGLDVDMGRFLDWVDWDDIDIALAVMLGGADVITGGSAADTLEGFAGDDVLNGRGGADDLVGGTGNDRYYVDNAGDAVIELIGQGRDQVVASRSYALTLGSSIESLSASGAAGAIALTGNSFGQTITGNASANAIRGGGGADVLDGRLGQDVLTGGTGSDTFFFSTALGSTNVDGITDFYAPQDAIRLDDAVFTGLAAGALASGAFRIGTAAGDADDRIVYDKATGALSFDRDGLGGAAAVKFAQLVAGTSLSAADFFVV
jgi:Ca2+-binding RTX toxin-like protein